MQYIWPKGKTITNKTSLLNNYRIYATKLTIRIYYLSASIIAFRKPIKYIKVC